MNSFSLAKKIVSQLCTWLFSITMSTQASLSSIYCLRNLIYYLTLNQGRAFHFAPNVLKALSIADNSYCRLDVYCSKRSTSECVWNWTNATMCGRDLSPPSHWKIPHGPSCDVDKFVFIKLSSYWALLLRAI